MCSDKICHIHGHLRDNCVVEGFYVLEHSLIFTCDEIDGHSFTTKPTTTANPVRKVVIHCNTALIDIAHTHYVQYIICNTRQVSSPVNVIFPIGW